MHVIKTIKKHYFMSSFNNSNLRQKVGLIVEQIHYSHDERVGHVEPCVRSFFMVLNFLHNSKKN